MILNAFFYLIYLFVQGIALLLSSADPVLPNSSIVNAVSTAGNYLAVVYEPLPLTTIALIGALGILLAYELGLGVYKLVKWGYSKIPGIN